MSSVWRCLVSWCQLNDTDRIVLEHTESQLAHRHDMRVNDLRNETFCLFLPAFCQKHVWQHQWNIVTPLIKTKVCLRVVVTMRTLTKHIPKPFLIFLASTNDTWVHWKFLEFLVCDLWLTQLAPRCIFPVKIKINMKNLIDCHFWSNWRVWMC